jgi:drug/metabolite transporter (DMT)-like permease
MTAIVLAALSAFLFGAMTVLVRIALRTGAAPEAGTLYTIVPAFSVTALVALGRGSTGDAADAWPFLFAGVLAPGIAQILFTFAVRDAGASRTSVTVGTAPLFAVAAALLFLDEPLVAGLVVGAALIVTGGILLASDGARPEHFARIGLVYALLCTVAFSLRDPLVRWLGTEATDVEPILAASVTMLSGTAVVLGFALTRRVALSRRSALRFVPAGACYGLSYVFLFEAFYRGRVTVVSPLVATETLWGVGLSAVLIGHRERVGRRLVVGAILIVAGGVLIGARSS